MLKQWRRKDIHLFLHLLGLSLIVIGMSFSKVLMSLGTLLSLFNLLVEANFKQYWTNIRTNKVLLWISGYFFLHILGLLWTSNIDYALHDLQIKVTLLIIPLVLICKPIEKKHFNFLLQLFIIVVLVSSLINFAFYTNIIGNRVYLDVRDMSIFGSHIRYAIIVVLAIVIAYSFSKETNKQLKFTYYLIISWLLFYTVYSQVLTGFLALITAISIYAFIKTYRQNKLYFLGIVISLLILIIFLIQFLIPQPIQPIYLKKLPQFTAEGNAYKNDYTLKGLSENQPIYYSICDEEMEREWNKLSSINYYGHDKLNQLLRTTIIRYLSSIHATKDASGIKKLTSKDIRAIENGVANVNETRFGIIARLYGLRFQLQNTNDPNGHSILQRLHYWKNAKDIISKNWLIGVGTGDVQIAFNKQYSLNNSPLTSQNRLRAHNTYLTSWITFGIIGLIAFIGIIFQFIKEQYNQKMIVGLLIGTIFFTTSFIEDTLETQLGVTIFAFFIALYTQRLGSDKSGFPIKE